MKKTPTNHASHDTEDFADLLDEEDEVVCLVKRLISEMAVWLLGYKNLKI